MVYINWTPDYDLGIEEIDRQHRRLVEIINRLHDAMEQGCPKGAMQGVVCDLVTYTGLHFAHEEKLMGQLDFPDRQLHSREHQALIRELEDFEVGLARGRLSVSLELMSFLKSWLLDHVASADRTLANYALGARRPGVLAICR